MSQASHTEPLTIVAPLPPYALHPNVRRGGATKIRAKKKHRSAVADEAAVVALEVLGQRPRWLRASVGLNFVFERPRRGGLQAHDPDNLIAWAKTTIDGLTDAGVFKDDRELIYLPPRQAWLPKGVTLPQHAQLEIVIWPTDPESCPICGKPNVG